MIVVLILHAVSKLLLPTMSARQRQAAVLARASLQAEPGCYRHCKISTGPFWEALQPPQQGLMHPSRAAGDLLE